MTDMLTWSINLGRWSGVQVRVHVFFVAFILGRLLSAVLADGLPIVPTVCWLLMLVLVLAIHELGHAAMAVYQNSEIDDIRLWPLGNFMAGPSRAAIDNVPVAVAGLVTTGFLTVVTAIVVAMAGGSMVFSPFGTGGDPGAPYIQGDDKHGQFPALGAMWFVGWFGHLNSVVFLANLIPALPFDGGRITRAILARTSVGMSRDNPYPQWMARACAGILTLVGLVKILTGAPLWVGICLFSLALLIELIVRTESRMIEDGGFFEDGVFGYDFSEGYTSLEAGTAKVRPYRESALKRWRRRRSELRRQRRVAREAAEDQRMDEILEKLHVKGKGALTDEEHRFLVRVSTKIRNNRARARD